MLKNLLTSLSKWIARPSAEPTWPAGPGEMILTLDAEGRILSASSSAKTLLWRTPDEIQGRLLSDFVWRSDHDDLNAALKNVGERDAPTATAFRIHHPNKPALWADATFRVEPSGRLCALIRDRSGIHARERVLRQSAEVAQSEAAARADLLADLSHEMKTPLNAILGFTDTMREETFGPLGHEKYDEYAELIHASGKHLMELITSILDFAKIEADRFIVQPEIANAGMLAVECAEMVRLSSEKAGLKLVLDIDRNLPDSLLDPRVVRQILLNLLSNAVKFTSDGEITISVRTEAEAVLLTVKDTGVGMSAEELAQLGGRFTTVQGDGVRGAKGTGLGLSLAFALAELHGGALVLQSAPGEGLTARLRLPLRGAIETDGQRVDEKPTDKKINILRSDDSNNSKLTSGGDILTQLERIDAFRREVATRRRREDASAA